MIHLDNFLHGLTAHRAAMTVSGTVHTHDLVPTVEQHAINVRKVAHFAHESLLIKAFFPVDRAGSLPILLLQQAHTNDFLRGSSHFPRAMLQGGTM